MAWLPDGETVSKISLFVLAQLTNVTDAQTDGHRVTAYTALMHTHRAVKTMTCRPGIMPVNSPGGNGAWQISCAMAAHVINVHFPDL